MNLFTGDASDAWFGGEVPRAIAEMLRRAAGSAPQARSAWLWSAQALAPACLAVYYVLYKHHTQRREFELAEQAARRGLQQAQKLAGIDAQGKPLPGHPAPDFLADGPARFWLFTRKALAFIALRQGRPDEARQQLAAIQALDAQARLGDDVVRELLKATDPGPAR